MITAVYYSSTLHLGFYIDACYEILNVVYIHFDQQILCKTTWKQNYEAQAIFSSQVLLMQEHLISIKYISSLLSKYFEM